MRTTDTDKQPSKPFGERRPRPDEQPKATPAPTTRGGKQYDLLVDDEAAPACKSSYGLCE